MSPAALIARLKVFSAAACAAVLAACAQTQEPAPQAVPAAAAAQQGTTYHSWALTVGSWNLMNFSLSKATYPAGGDRVNLLTRMGAIAGGYDIIVFQEVLQTGASVTAHLVNYLPAGYACNHVSAPSGRVGRQERYVICAPPANAAGTIAIAPLTDCSTTGVAYLAADGTMQPAANVWMRPPIIATVTYTPNDPTFAPVTFSLYTNHTKPAYGHSAQARPPGTVAGAPNSSSVHYELRAIEQNLAAGANKMLIGDLNADCASYPVGYRGTDLAAWTWHVNYGQRTNTAVGTACAYDRILLNGGLSAYYQNHGVNYDHFGNATTLDGKRVSDHYPVWVRLGQATVKAAPALTASASAPVTQANKRRKFARTDTVHSTGTQLLPSATSAQFYITSYTTARNYKSNFAYPLTDVRGAPTPVTTDADGGLNQTVSWSNPEAGAYVFVFDANGDGRFSLADGDFANYATQADILVTESSTGHNDLVTLGDNMVLRDVFDLAQAYNIYALAKNLPANLEADAYIVSDRLLAEAGYRSWERARADRIALAPYAIPIQLADAGVIDTSRLTDADRKQSFRSNSEGEVFFSAWPRPGQLMNASVNYQAPPASAFDPAFAGEGDPPASPDDTDYDEDPCQNASSSKDDAFREACNLGFLFSNYYGNTFNLVFDLDGDGRLGPDDPVDTRDIGDMTAYFNGAGHDVLGPNANGDPAVSEYKEYLERALSVQLSDTDAYDQDTKAASGRYACGPELSKADFERWIAPDSQTGFRVLDDDAYHSERSNASALFQFDVAYLHDWSTDNVEQCISGGNLSYGGDMTSENQAHVTSVAQTHTFENAQVSSNNATQCWVAVEATAGTAIAVGAGSGFFTAGAGWLVGAAVAAGANLTGALACGF